MHKCDTKKKRSPFYNSCALLRMSNNLEFEIQIWLNIYPGPPSPSPYPFSLKTCLKFSYFCYLPLCRVCLIRQLSGALPTKTPSVFCISLNNFVNNFSDIWSDLSHSPNSSFSAHSSTFWGPSGKVISIYLNYIALEKCLHVCHFRQICQLFEALLAKWSLFMPVFSSTGLAKFRHISHFLQIRCFRHICQLSGALLAKSSLFSRIILSTSLSKFRRICTIDKTSTDWQISSIPSISSTIFVTAYMSGHVSTYVGTKPFRQNACECINKKKEKRQAILRFKNQWK